MINHRALLSDIALFLGSDSSLLCVTILNREEEEVKPAVIVKV